MTESNQWKAFERTDGMQISNSKKDCSISFLIRKGCWPYSHHFDIGFYSIHEWNCCLVFASWVSKRPIVSFTRVEGWGWARNTRRLPTWFKTLGDDAGSRDGSSDGCYNRNAFFKISSLKLTAANLDEIALLLLTFKAWWSTGIFRRNTGWN